MNVISTPHSWHQLNDLALSLDVTVLNAAINPLTGKVHQVSAFVQANNKRDELDAVWNEADALASKDNISAEDQKRLDHLTEVEEPKIQAEIKRLEGIDAREKQRVLDHISTNPTAKGLIRFKNAETGAEVRAYTPSETLFNQADANPYGDGLRNSDEALGQFGDSICNLLTGRHGGIENALTSSDANGGFLVPDQVSRSVVDLARSASVAMKAGVQTVPMTTPELSLLKVAEDPEAVWRPEMGHVTSSDIKFERITLRLKSLAAIVPVSEELLEDAQANASQVIIGAIGAAMGLAIDTAILSGTGVEHQPLGIRNTVGVNSIDAVGVPANYANLSAAVQAIFGANYPGEASGLSWIMNPRDAGIYDGLTATDGQPLQPTPWAGALKKFPTTSLPVDLGDNSDESEMIVGDFSQVVLGVRPRGIQVKILEAGSVRTGIDSNGTPQYINAVSQIAKFIVVTNRVDVGIIRPSWMSVLSGVKAS